MITVKSAFLSICLKLCMLTASPYNSSSLILCLIVAGGNFFELYPTNLNPLFYYRYRAAHHETPLVSETRVKCPLLFGMTRTGGFAMPFFNHSKIF